MVIEQNILHDPKHSFYARSISRRDGEIHAHDFYELIIVTGGTGDFFSGAAGNPIAKGSVIAIPRRHCHGFSNTKDLQCYVIDFNEDYFTVCAPRSDHVRGFQALFHHQHLPRGLSVCKPLKFQNLELIKLADLCEQMCTEFNEKKENWQISVTALLTVIFVQVLRRIQAEDVTNYYYSSLKKAEDYMLDNIGRKIDIGELAAHLCVSARTLQRLFKKSLGHSPIEYLMKLRLAKAKLLLTQTEMPVTEIARLCGYENPGYFARHFQQYHGLPPRQFRNACRPALY